MNIEIANRLVKLRKEKGLSQEELADKLGLSRQAVSKWERAEASPDTDNLICLAKLYGVSLDKLLKTDDETETIIDEQVKKDEAPSEEATKASEEEKKENEDNDRDGNGKREHVHIGLNGIHVVDKDGEVHIDLHGIHVHDKDNNVDIDGDGIKNMGKFNCNVQEEGHHWKDHRGSKIGGILSGVYAMLAVVAYILLGSFVPGAWGYAWILFLLIPVIGSIPSAITHRSFSVFCYPLLATAVYFFLCMVLPALGVMAAMWHPLWVIFLTIPVYYMIFGPIDASIRRHRCCKNIYFSKGNVVENEDDEEDEDDDDDDEEDEDEKGKK